MTRNLFLILISDLYTSDEIKDKLMEVVGADPDPIIVINIKEMKRIMELFNT